MKLGNLKTLDLHSNQITGGLTPAVLRSLTSLKYLVLENNQFADPKQAKQEYKAVLPECFIAV